MRVKLDSTPKEETQHTLLFQVSLGSLFWLSNLVCIGFTVWLCLRTSVVGLSCIHLRYCILLLGRFVWLVSLLAVRFGDQVAHNRLLLDICKCLSISLMSGQRKMKPC